MDQAASNDVPERSAEWTALRAKETLAGWSDEDITWLEAFKPMVARPVAERYGRHIMELVVLGGVIGHAVQIIAGSKPPQAVAKAVGVLAMHCDVLMNAAVVGGGVDPKLFISCQEDLNRLAALQDDGHGGKRSAGGIILAS